MKRKRRVRWNVLGIIGILLLFILTLLLPASLPFAKAGAILLYVMASYGEISYMHYKRQSILLPILFCIGITSALIYILFFM